MKNLNFQEQIELLNIKKENINKVVKENSKKELNAFINEETKKASKRTKEQFIVGALIFAFIVTVSYVIINSSTWIY